MPAIYKKRLGLFRNPAVQRELVTLDPVRDHQRIVHLLTAYEFPFDIARALELALFHTYTSPRVSGLLARTGEFEHHGQKRYDDTSRPISEFLESGYDSEKGLRAIAHMNKIHGHYRIDNADFLFVLATFVFYPIDWLRNYGWRKLTSAEEQALFYFFREVGRRMQLTDLPDNLADFQTFVAEYEARYFRYTESNRKITNATVRIVQGWFPGFLHGLVQPTFAALISDKLRTAFGYERPAGWFTALVNSALCLRKWPLRWITFKPYPALIPNTSFRYYPAGPPTIEAVGPTNLIDKPHSPSA
ncbi:oxygenase MpaB family protein [Spirosoma aerolatum]|uniref:oxygenase MpaB family protein n=1 Tax=Spirosoma aerolatum TaxID=1211326 RepID=UPI0009AC658E|nr:oxygenase MpaB family protein [Spirosoma aerolatum]